MTTREEQLASAHAPELYLVQMDFTTGTQRLTNWGHNVQALGYTWIGLGALVSIGMISESERLEYPAVDLGLQVSDRAQLALALGNVFTYRGKPVTIWQQVLDDELRPVYAPEVVWAGVMDQVRVKTGDGERDQGAAVMRCEVPGRDGRGPASLRMNNAQQQARFPGDTGLSRIERLVGQPVTWLSKRFQER